MPDDATPAPQPAPPDYVNDVPDWYPDDWPKERRCSYVYDSNWDYRGRTTGGRFCGYPTLEGADLCLFHTDGSRDWALLKSELLRALSAHVCLVRAKLANAPFAGLNLSRGSLGGADLRGAHLEGADLTRAWLGGADLSGAHLDRAVLEGAELLNARLCGASLVQANLAGAGLSMCDLSDAHLQSANLSGAVSNYARFARSSMHRANLAGAVLERGDFSGACLRWANLSDVQAVESSLKDADLRAAKLRGDIDLRGADLDGAMLTWAEVSPEAKLEGIRWPNRPRRSGRGGRTIYDERLVNDDEEWSRVVRSGRAISEDRPTFDDCERVYRQLKRNAQHQGEQDRAGAFHVCEMECKRAQLKSPIERGVYGLLYFLSDYFENWMRVTAIGLIVIALGALLQGLCGIRTAPEGSFVVGPGWGIGWPTWGSIVKAIYFSVMTFTATGYGDYVPSPGLGQVLSSLEALSGVFLMALLLVCLARRYGRA